MLYVCILFAYCGSSQCCVLHDLQLVNAGRGCQRRPYGRGILQSWSHNCLVGNRECLLLFTPSCCSECFMICSGLCACTEMFWMCVEETNYINLLCPIFFLIFTFFLNIPREKNININNCIIILEKSVWYKCWCITRRKLYINKYIYCEMAQLNQKLEFWQFVTNLSENSVF